MATRRVLNVKPKVDLKEVIKQYFEDKQLLSKYDKSTKEYNNIIKMEMTNTGIDTFNADGIIATVTSSQSEEFNEALAIEILKQNLTVEQQQEVIKSREYVDNDALEKLIYNKSLDAAILAPCITKKPAVYTLRISKEK